MTQDDHKEMQELLQKLMPPMNRELRRDLWPALLDRMETPSAAFAWYDWALIAALAGWLLFYPQETLQLFYHL